MKHIKIVARKPLLNEKVLKFKGCRECQTPCKSACKTSSTVGNQVCERERKPDRFIF